jgi:SOS-response transcriptional repressor LexA
MRASLPIIGCVVAGTPILAVENLEGYPEIHRLVGKRQNLFVLRLKGGSMGEPWIDRGMTYSCAPSYGASTGTSARC